MRLVALQSFVHGRPYRRGGPIEVGERAGHELIRKGLAQVPAAGVVRPGLTYVILASGPSLTADDSEAVRHWRAADASARRVIAINTTYQLAPWADLLYACDLRWWEEHVQQTAALDSERWTQSTEAARRFGLRLVRGKQGEGLGRGDIVHLGGNSGYQAIGLAYLQGARRIILLGYDMQPTGGKSHWHGDHPWKKTGQVPPVRSWIPRFSKLAADLREEGVEVINATRETALQCFPRASLEDVL